jgi:hypothetical protein
MDNNEVILLLDEHNFINFYNLKGKKIRGAAYELGGELVNLEELHKFKTDDRFLLFEEYQKTFNIESLIMLNSIGNIVYEPRADEYPIRVFPTKDKNKFLLNICKELDLELGELEVFCSILTVHPDPKKDIITAYDVEVSAPVYMCEEKLHYDSDEGICSFYDIDNDILYIYYKPSFIKAISGIVNNKIIDHFKVNVPDHFDFKDFAIFDKNLVIRNSDNNILNIDLSGTVSISKLNNLLSFIGSNKHLHYYIFEDTSKNELLPDFLGYIEGKSEDSYYLGIVKGFAIDYYNDITLPYYDCDGMAHHEINDYNLKLILIRDCSNANLLWIYDLDKEEHIGKVDLSDVYNKIVNKDKPLRSSNANAAYFSLSFSKRWELILVRVDFSKQYDKIYDFVINKFGNIIFSVNISKEIAIEEPEQYTLIKIVNKDYSDIAFVNIIYSKYEIEINFYNNEGKPLYHTCNIKPEGEVNKVSKDSFSVYRGDVIAFCYSAFVESEGEKEFTNCVTCIYNLKSNKLVRQLVDYSLSYYD